MATHGEHSSLPNIGEMDHDEFLNWLSGQTFWPKWKKDELFEPLRDLLYDGRMFCGMHVPEVEESQDKFFLGGFKGNKPWYLFNRCHLEILKNTLVGLFPGFGSTEQTPGGMHKKQPEIEPVIPGLWSPTTGVGLDDRLTLPL